MTGLLTPPTRSPLAAERPIRDGLAIVGMDCLFPEADGVDQFWQNVLDRRCSIGPIEDRSLPVGLRDRVESRLGALMPHLVVKPQKFRLPPNITRNFDPRVLPMLEVVRRLLALHPNARPESMLAILCCQKMMPVEEASTSLNRRIKTLSLIDELASLHRLDAGTVERIRSEFSDAYDQKFPNPGFEGFLAESSSLMASIIPKTFNLSGGHISMDATCASVIAALQIAWNALYSGQNDSALVVALSPEAVPSRFAHYAQLGIFTREAVLPFDEAASGSALGEGIGVMLVKRLRDAEAAGDTIHAVIRGVGFSSDGAGSGFVSPQRDGQVRAMRNAYRMSGIDPHQVRLVEAHATGTPKGDMTELESLETIFGKPADCSEKVVLGSVKSNIGHLLAASGMAGVFKVCKALSEGVMPPTIFRTLRPELRNEQTRFELLNAARPWPEDAPRLAAVSSFGFGGVNAHAILEAHPSTAKKLQPQRTSQILLMPVLLPEAPVTTEVLPPAHSMATPAYQMLSDGEVAAGVLGIVANCTGYEVEELQLDHDLDADLGVDSIKHMEILLMVGERFRVQAEEGDQITDYPTIERLVELARTRQNTSTGEPSGMMAELMAGLQSGELPPEAAERLAQMGVAAPAPEVEAVVVAPEVKAVVATPEPVAVMPGQLALVAPVVEDAPKTILPASESSGYQMLSDGEVAAGVLGIVANCTGYEVEELQLDHDLDADLGVDSIKHMEILLMVGERFRVQAEEGDQITDYPTIERLVELARTRQNTSTGEPSGMMAELMAGLQSGELPPEAAERLAQMGVAAPAPEVEAVVVAPEVKAVVATPEPVVVAPIQVAAPATSGLEKVQETVLPASESSGYQMLSDGEVAAGVLGIVANCTGYEVEELQLDHDLDADLGVDSIKHMEILLMVGERFRVQAEEGDQITDYPTIERLVELARTRQNTSTGEPSGMMAELMAGLQSGELPPEAAERLAQMGVAAPAPEVEAVVAMSETVHPVVVAAVEEHALQGEPTVPVPPPVAPEMAEAHEPRPSPVKPSQAFIPVNASQEVKPVKAESEVLNLVKKAVAAIRNYEPEWLQPHLSLVGNLKLKPAEVEALLVQLGLPAGARSDWTLSELAAEKTALLLPAAKAASVSIPTVEDWVLVVGRADANDPALAKAIHARLQNSKGAVLRLEMPEGRDSFALVIDRHSALDAVANRLAQAAGRSAPLASVWWGEANVRPGALAWLFPGSGTLYAGLLGELTGLDPVASEVVNTAEKAFQQFVGQPLNFGTLNPEALFQRPATVTTSAAIARLLSAFGITPDFVAGHSVGELTACYLAGAIELPELIRLTSAPFIGQSCPSGAMAAVLGPEETTLKLLKTFAGRLVVSNRNSSQQLVVSGLEADVQAFTEVAKKQGLKAIQLEVQTAYHSPLLAGAHRQYREALSQSKFQMPTVPVVSGLTADLLPWSSLDACQTRALLDCAFIAPVNHVGQLRRLQELGAQVLIDIGPTDRLARLARETLDGVTVLAATRAKRNSRLNFLETLAQLHVLGYAVKSSAPELPPEPLKVMVNGHHRPQVATLAHTNGGSPKSNGHTPSATALAVKPAELSAIRVPVVPVNGHHPLPTLTPVAPQPSAPLREEAPPATKAAPAYTTKPTPDLRSARPSLLEPIAIVGMGALLPDANNVAEFWQNLISGHDAIRELPQGGKEGRWKIDTFYNPDPRVPDKTYSKIGAFVPNFEFKPIEFRVTPKTAIHMDRSQKMALLCTRDAFRDSGYHERTFDRKRVRVIIGTSVPEWHDLAAPRLFFDYVAEAFQRSEVFQLLPADVQAKLVAQAREDINRDIPACCEDSMPGGLPNIVAGRVAFCFDLQGGNVIVDAACAASFAALDNAVKALRLGEIDMVVVGGSDSAMSAGPYVGFCKTYALSAKGSFPFDSRADGFVMGEGSGILLLKRLGDAERDSDSIHAVIRGIGSSSDGRGRGITAPSLEGQVLAMERAYHDAGIDPATIGFVEAHGTSTALGDATEFASLVEFFGPTRRSTPLYLGSVKSMIGHLKTAAGVAGLIKSVLAVKNGQVPPTINFESPNPKIDLANSPFTINTVTRDWEHQGSTPRRAAANSFGFGGTNFHVILEAYDRDFYQSEAFENEVRASRTYQTFYADSTPAVAALPVANTPVSPVHTPSPTAATAPIEVLDLATALKDTALPLAIVGEAAPRVVVTPASGDALVGRVSAYRAQDLGAASFRRDHGVRFNYVAGAMAAGIGSVDIVVAMAKAGMLGFFGSGGVPLNRVEQAIVEVKEKLTDHPGAAFGFNLLHNPIEAGVEDRTVDLYLQHGVRKVSASAYLRLMPSVVRYRATGMHRLENGQIVAPNSVFAKVSSLEVAAQFMAPPPESVLKQLVASGRLTPEEAQMAALLPVANDITAEADSGGHTDRRPLPVLLPQMLRLRDEIFERHGYARQDVALRIGAAGGLGDPLSVRSALALGADYILTGSINQTSPQSGTSQTARQMLTKASMADVVMAPAADMFEMGVQVQVLKRGSFYAQRARKLYEVYKTYDGFEAIPAEERTKLERDIFRQPLQAVWENTANYWQGRDPKQLEKANRDGKHKMALAFRAYLGLSSRWAQTGDSDRKSDYQIWCGPAMGLFNSWVAGTWLEPLENRDVALLGLALLDGAAVLTRAERLASFGLIVPSLSVLTQPAERDVLLRL